jgi:hypothetical protein
VNDVVGGVPLLRVAAAAVNPDSLPGLSMRGKRLAESADAAPSHEVDLREERAHAAGRNHAKVAQGLQFFQVPPGRAVRAQNVGEPPLDLRCHGKAISVDETEDRGEMWALLDRLSLRPTVGMEGCQ